MLTRLVSLLRSPWLRLGGVGLLALALVYAGRRWERGQHELAAAVAARESSEREARLADEAATARAQADLLQRIALDVDKRLREAIAARESVEARVRPRKGQASSGAVPTPRVAPVAQPSSDPGELPAPDCAILLAAVEAERDRYRDALDAEGALNRRLRTAMAATSAQLAERDLQLQAARTGEVKLERRSQRRGAVIAWSLLGGFAAGVAMERI